MYGHLAMLQTRSVNIILHQCGSACAKLAKLSGPERDIGGDGAALTFSFEVLLKKQPENVDGLFSS